MAVFQYYNGYNPGNSNQARHWEVGEQLIQVWTHNMVFGTQRERNQYLKNPHDEHVLSLEANVVDGVHKFVYFYDDQPANITPVLTIPTDEELTNLLITYGQSI